MWEKALISPDTPILKAMGIIDQTALQIALVVNAERQLLGTVTDGDIRRAILRHIDLNHAASNIMNPNPWYVKQGQLRENILMLMKEKKIRQIPIVDEQNRVVGLETADDLRHPPLRNNPVVFMAGGRGSRLHPLTEVCPKPLLKVGDKPILETILDGFIEQGFRRFYISVNYRADMIIEYFGDGSNWNAEINYLRETIPLGTAGSLGLLTPRPELPILVINGDILTKADYGQLLNFHLKNNMGATVCIKEQFYQIPYGVVTFSNNRLLQLDEKPIQKFFINAGIYILNPEVLNYISQGSCIDITDLIKILLESGHQIAVFPIREYWLDIGRINDFERANMEFAEVFR
jgi:dTDP-glucose pyrophosphorylase